MGWPVRVFQNLIYLNKKVESDLGTLLTTPKSTQNENIRSNECQSSLLLTYRQCRRRWPAARGGGGTRRWPSPRPRGSCRSAHRRKVTQSKVNKVTKFQCKVHLHGRGLSAPRPGPHEQLVVVTPAGQVLEKYFGEQLKIFKCLQSCYLAVGGPLEAAHLLPVAHQPPLRSNTWGSDISLE